MVQIKQLLIFLFGLVASLPVWSGKSTEVPLFQMSLTSGSSIYTEDFESATQRNVAVDVEGEESFGLALDLFHSEAEDGYLTYHIYIAESNAELKITDDSTQQVQISHFKNRFYQLGGSYHLWSPDLAGYTYGGATIGLAQLEASGFDNEDKFAFSLFGGIDWGWTESFGAKLDLRIQGIVLDGNGQILCSGGCEIKAQSDVWFNYHLTAGLYFQF